jgi:phosphoglycolate phosphatase-like HAD superfamily hydrolase
VDQASLRSLAFLDLDLTLFNYTSAREGATRAALLAMDAKSDITGALHLLNTILVPYGDLLVNLGLPNFRREWGAPELFALIEVVSNKGHQRNDAVKLRKILKSIDRRNQTSQNLAGNFWSRLRGHLMLNQSLEQSFVRALLSEMKRWLETPTLQRRINDAIAAFDEHLIENAALFDGVDELFEALIEHGYEIYVVSEGEEEIQKRKTSLLGLNNRTHGIFVSSECCRSERLLRWLWDTGLDANASGRDALSNDRVQAVAVVYDEVFRYSVKTEALFRKVLHTILLPQSSWLDFYGRFGWLKEAARNDVRILLFGDRYDKDLCPGIEAFGNVVSIRLLSGKYKHTYTAELLSKWGLPHPTATVKSVRYAAELIRTMPSEAEMKASLVSVPPADADRVRRFYGSLRVIQESFDEVPAWIADSLEGLGVALQGSEEYDYE